MNTYRLTLTLKGPLGTPLSADTLWGHVCWGIVYREGQEALARFLEASATDAPPLVLSDPLPAGFLPRPVLPPVAPDEEDAIVGRLLAGTDAIEQSDRLAAARRVRYLPLDRFRDLASKLSAACLLEALLRQALARAPALTTTVVAHNTINRLTNHTLSEGGLFFQSESFAGGSTDYDLWIASPWPAERVREIFTWALEGGYGRDASTGKGNLAVGDIRPDALPAARDANALMTLGPCAPAETDPSRGFWTTETRFGKLGGPWALQTEDGGVFKHPVIFLAAGAVLAGPPRTFLGRIVSGVHPARPEVVQCGLTLAVPVRCPHFEEGC